MNNLTNYTMAKGIFCLETEWDFSTKKLKDPTSVEPMLNFMKNINKMDFVYRRVATKPELVFYLKELSKATFNKYEIVYFSFHGETRSICLEGENKNNSSISLNEIAELANGAFYNKFVHFSTCNTLTGSESEIEYFKKVTNARLVSGYTRGVDYTLSSILDIAYFNELEHTSIKFGTIENRLNRHYSGLIKKLGFKIV